MSSKRTKLDSDSNRGQQKPSAIIRASSSDKSSEDKSITSPTFKMEEIRKDLTDIPIDSILVHATNCFGEWGAGVALAIHNSWPKADEVYTAHCNSFRAEQGQAKWPTKDGLVGTCLLIPPQEGDLSAELREKGDATSVAGVWIACLFTSYGYGRTTKKHARRDSKGEILTQTKAAVKDLRRQLEKLKLGRYQIETVGDMRKLKLHEEEKGPLEHDQVGGKRKRTSNQEKKQVVETAQMLSSEGIVHDIYSVKFNSGNFGIPWDETKAICEEVFHGREEKWFVLT